MRTSLFRALAIAAALIAGAPALAQSEIRSMAVSYGDLNLAHAAGRAALDRRVANAAKQVCGFEYSRELQRAIIERRCVADTIDRTQRAVLAAVEGQSTVRVASASVGRDAAVR